MAKSPTTWWLFHSGVEKWQKLVDKDRTEHENEYKKGFKLHLTALN